MTIPIPIIYKNDIDTCFDNDLISLLKWTSEGFQMFVIKENNYIEN
jgi:hypothetical protein